MSHNQPPRLGYIFQIYDPPVFFVTLCTAGRRKLLANVRAHRAFAVYARRALDDDIAVGRYVMMPDHIYLFVAGGRDFDLGLWVRGLMRPISKTSGSPLAAGFWQRGFFDHLIRNTESYAQKWEYVRENPVGRGWWSVPTNGLFRVK